MGEESQKIVRWRKGNTESRNDHHISAFKYLAHLPEPCSTLFGINERLEGLQLFARPASL
ncbi:putative RING finger protein P8B7.23 [Clarias magur]|uniref:Putative RING finger protein P8B7.23 n=1 Tax=Clarias magur TaxID=1594786 RepID=A0A8J4UR33_CLAMG|nr:putative RING finger protein P8B7.23 [Clarias magur]